jgi:programmed cell death protein 5
LSQDDVSADIARQREELLRRRLQRDLVLRSKMTVEARQRLANVRMVKPELAEMVEEYIYQLALSGKIRGPMTEEELKVILMNVQKPRREFKIRWA